MTSFVFDELDKKPYPKKPYPAPHVVVLTCPSKEERAEREAFERSVMISILKGKEQRDRSMQKPCRRWLDKVINFLYNVPSSTITPYQGCLPCGKLKSSSQKMLPTCGLKPTDIKSNGIKFLSTISPSPWNTASFVSSISNKSQVPERGFFLIIFRMPLDTMGNLY